MSTPKTFSLSNKVGQLNIRIPKVYAGRAGLSLTLTDIGLTAGKSKQGFKHVGVGLGVLELELLLYKRG